MLKKMFINKSVKQSLTENIINSDEQLKSIIVQEHINPAYVKDVEDTIKWRYLYRKIGNIFENSSKLLSAGSTIFAFSAGFFVDIKPLSFIAGILGTLSLVSVQLSVYSLNESKECTAELNKILSTFSINNMPDIDSYIETKEHMFNKNIIPSTKHLGTTPSNSPVLETF